LSFVFWEKKEIVSNRLKKIKPRKKKAKERNQMETIEAFQPN
jgi:hypothetical protein